jgi:peptide/nickel transport system substrate-binding protein
VRERSSRRVVRIIGALGLLAAFACGGSEHHVFPPQPQPVSYENRSPEDGGTTVRRLETDVRTLNPILINNSSEKQVLSYLFDALVELDAQAHIVPGAASKWEISPDGKIYTFHLDPKGTFSDGRPVLASDVVFTLKKILSDSTQLSGAFEGLQLGETRAVDPSTVQVVFDHVRAGQLLAFNIPILPEHVYSVGDFHTAFTDKVVGNGPYKLVRRIAGSEIVLSRRPDYPGVKPHIDGVVLKIISDSTVAWNALRRGDIDEMELSSEQWRLAKDDAALQKQIDIRLFYRLGYNFIPWNDHDAVLSDKRVRRALAKCLDRTSIISHIYYGTARIITGPFTPDQWAYNPAVAPIEFDPQAARGELQAAGWIDRNKDGVLEKGDQQMRIEMLIPAGSRTTRDQAQIFQSALKSVGVRLDLVPVENAIFIQRVSEGKFQSAFLGWDLDLDPDLYSIFHSSQFPPKGSNFVYYSNPQVDQLIVEGRETLDQDERVKIYQQLHALFADDQPYTWIVQEATKWATSRRIQGARTGRGLGPFNWTPGPREWWIPHELQRASEPARRTR